MRKLVTFLVMALLPFSLFANWELLDLSGPMGGITGEVQEIRAHGDSLLALTEDALYISVSGVGGDWVNPFGTINNLRDVQIAQDRLFVVSRPFLFEYNVAESRFDTLKSTGLEVNLAEDVFDGTGLGGLGFVDEITYHETDSVDYLYAYAFHNAGVYRMNLANDEWELYNTIGDTVTTLDSLLITNDTVYYGDSMAVELDTVTVEWEPELEGLAYWNSERYISKQMIVASNGYLISNYKTGIQVSKDNGESWYWIKGNYELNNNATASGVFEHEYEGVSYIWTSNTPYGNGFRIAATELTDSVGLVWERKDETLSASGRVFGIGHTEKFLFAYGSSSAYINVTHDNGQNFRQFAPAFHTSIGEGNGGFNKISVLNNKLYLPVTVDSILMYDLTVAPSWVSEPVLSDTASTSVQLNYEVSHFGSVYTVVLPQGDAAPSAAQVMAGTDAADQEANAQVFAAEAVGQGLNSTVTMLQPDTEYAMYVVFESTSLLSTATVSSLDFVTPLSTYDITFQVTDGTSPLADAAVDFDGQVLQTDPVGRVLFADVVEATDVAFTVSKDGYYDSTATVDVLNSKTVSVALTMITYTVDFVVTDTAGNPVENAEVSFNSVSLFTNAAGMASFTDVVGSGLAYSISKDSYVTAEGTLDVTADLQEPVTLDPEPTYNVTFTVTDGTDPLQGASVTLDGDAQTTNASGVVVFSSLPVASGLAYSVELTDYITENGSIDIVDDHVSQPVTLTMQSSIAEAITSQLVVYPNPTKGQVYVATGNADESLVVVFDALGTPLKTVKGTGTIKVSLSEQPAGVYLIQFEGKTFRVIKK